MPESLEEERVRPWNLIDLRDCLQDSPGFRRTLAGKEQEIADLEMKVEKVAHFCTKMVESGKEYMSTCRMFASSMRELSYHFTTISSVQNALIKFCEVLNELQSSYSVLFDQAKNAVAKGLRGFLTGELKKAKDSKKVFHRVSEDLSYAIHKNAQVSKHKPLEAEEASTMLQTNFTEFTHQSLDYCYQLNVLSCIKGHEIVDKLLQFMDAQSSCLNHGLDTLKELDPYLRALKQEMEELQQTSDVEIQNMENRHNMVTSQQLEECLEQPPVSLDNPAASIELSGYLFKKASTGFRLWNRRYFVLKDNKLVYLRKETEHSQTGQNDYGVVAEDLRICTVKPADDLERRFCFEVVTPVRSCMLQADSEAMRRKWCAHLEAGIARALRGTTSNRRKEELKESQRHDSVTRRFDSPVFNPRSDTPSSIQSNYSLGLDFLDVPGNDLCADCNASCPKWASINLGIVLCIECSGIHRSLGVHISKVRSLTLDDWETEQQKIMCALGNTRVNGILEYEIPKHIKKLTPNSTVPERETYIRQKYVLRAFVHPHPNFERPEIPVPPPKVQGTLLSAAAASSSPRSPRGGVSPLASRSPYSATSSPRTSHTLNQHTRPFSVAMPSDSRSTLTESMPSFSTHSIPSLQIDSNSSAAGRDLGGMNIRPESMALLEANWKKLAKSGKLQKWNFSRVASVRPPKVNFSFSKFARPGSFRKRKNTKDSELSYSDNELDKDADFRATTSHWSKAEAKVVAAGNDAPPKPPRTYTTMPSDLEEEDKSASSLFSDEKDDFSSDLLNTFKKLGSVYSLSGTLNEDGVAPSAVAMGDVLGNAAHDTASHSSLHLPGSGSGGLLPNDSGSMMRSASAMGSLAVEVQNSSSRSSGSLRASRSFDAGQGEEDELADGQIRASSSSECLLLDGSAAISADVIPNRKLSLSMDSLEVLKEDSCLYQTALQSLRLHTLPRRSRLPPSPISVETTFVHPAPGKRNVGLPHKQEGRGKTPVSRCATVPLSYRRENPVEPIVVSSDGHLLRPCIRSTSGSLDSFTTAQDNAYASSPSPSPDYSSTVDAFIRPDSSASELFETPPNSLDSPSPLQKAVEGNLSLFPSISLQDSGSSESFHARELSDATLTVGGALSDSTGDERPVANDASDDSHTPYPSPERKRRPVSGSPLHDDDVFGGNGEHMEAIYPPSSSVVAELSPGDSSSLDREEPDLEAGTECDLIVVSGRQSQESSFEPVIIPDSTHPTLYLFECSQTTDLPGLLCALVHGGLVNQGDPEEGGRYPIHQACLAGNDMVVEFLYQNGAKIGVVDSMNCTPLHLAAMNDDASLVALLLKRGVNHQAIDKDGKKPLHYALERENAETVTLLRLVEVNAQARSEGSEESHRFMSETMAGAYKDIAVAAVVEPERIKRRSVSSLCSTPPSGGSSREEVHQMPVVIDDDGRSSPSNVLGDHPPSIL